MKPILLLIIRLLHDLAWKTKLPTVKVLQEDEVMLRDKKK
jgi:hypothetical protein